MLHCWTCQHIFSARDLKAPGRLPYILHSLPPTAGYYPYHYLRAHIRYTWAKRRANFRAATARRFTFAAAADAYLFVCNCKQQERRPVAFASYSSPVRTYAFHQTVDRDNVLLQHRAMWPAGSHRGNRGSFCIAQYLLRMGITENGRYLLPAPLLNVLWLFTPLL